MPPSGSDPPKTQTLTGSFESFVALAGAQISKYRLKDTNTLASQSFGRIRFYLPVFGFRSRWHSCSPKLNTSRSRDGCIEYPV